MIDPSTIADAITNQLRSIEEVVIEMDGRSENIFTYEDEFPAKNDLFAAIRAMTVPGIMVVWMGTVAARRREHKWSLILRAAGKYTSLCHAIDNGVPLVSGGAGHQRFRIMQLVPHVDPIGGITYERRGIPLNDAQTLDYFEATFSVFERGSDA